MHEKILAEMRKHGYVPQTGGIQCIKCELTDSFGTCYPEPRRTVCDALRLSNTAQICVATNGAHGPFHWVLMPTHELPKE